MEENLQNQDICFTLHKNPRFLTICSHRFVSRSIRAWVYALMLFNIQATLGNGGYDFCVWMGMQICKFYKNSIKNILFILAFY